MKREPLEGGGFIERHPFLGVNFYDENGRRDVLICHNPLADEPKPKKNDDPPHW